MAGERLDVMLVILFGLVLVAIIAFIIYSLPNRPDEPS